MERGPLPETFFGLPLGATREVGSHKGYGLGCVVDILCGVLSGGGYGMTTGSEGNYKHMVAAYKIDAFTPVDQFKEMMDEFLRTLRNTPPAPGHDRVFYAGLPEAEAEQERNARGIPLHREVIQWFRDICGEMGIAWQLSKPHAWLINRRTTLFPHAHLGIIQFNIAGLCHCRFGSEIAIPWFPAAA